MTRAGNVSMLTALVLVAVVQPARAQTRGESPRCDFSDVPGAVWWGTESRLPLERFVAYTAPVFWHSPDEPELEGKSGAEITVPEALPLESADGPVVYYQLKEIQTAKGTARGVFARDSASPGQSIVDLTNGG
ncbi:MAG: hypothetical protein ACWGON_00485, partial [Gemmatimonadota bacterium]